MVQHIYVYYFLIRNFMTKMTKRFLIVYFISREVSKFGYKNTSEIFYEENVDYVSFVSLY